MSSAAVLGGRAPQREWLHLAPVSRSRLRVRTQVRAATNIPDGGELTTSYLNEMVGGGGRLWVPAPCPTCTL